MAKQIQYCACKVNLAGQNCHIISYNQFNPVSWPEVQVLQALHGDENVMDIMPVGIGEVWPTEEKNRLIGLYGHRIVEACFPGRAFRMDYMMTDEVNLPQYDGGKPVTAVAGDPKPPPQPDPKPQPRPQPDDEDDDGGEDEVVRATAQLEPIFKPSPRVRRTPPPPLPEIPRGP